MFKESKELDQNNNNYDNIQTPKTSNKNSNYYSLNKTYEYPEEKFKELELEKLKLKRIEKESLKGIKELSFIGKNLDFKFLYDTNETNDTNNIDINNNNNQSKSDNLSHIKNAIKGKIYDPDKFSLDVSWLESLSRFDKEFERKKLEKQILDCLSEADQVT
jgi:hypothetical protein